LDKAKAYPFLKKYHADAVAQVEYMNFRTKPRVLDYKDYEIPSTRFFRFNPRTR